MEHMGCWSRLRILIYLPKMYKERETVQNASMNTGSKIKSEKLVICGQS
jgi:hypothetical protein